MRTQTTAIAILAKAPTAGLAKTRLAPALGLAGAAALAAQLLQHAVAQALAAQLGPVTLWVTPSQQHPAFDALAAAHPQLLWAQQCAGDVGQRMAHTFESHFACHFAGQSSRPAGPLLLMGTDLPGLTAQVLQQAAAALAQTGAVLVPALDGGYGLLGLHQPQATLFEGVHWSTAQVLAQTRRRLLAATLKHTELAPLADIDEPADLVHLPPGWQPALGR
jgi:uncharacterized protein